MDKVFRVNRPHGLKHQNLGVHTHLGQSLGFRFLCPAPQTPAVSSWSSVVGFRGLSGPQVLFPPRPSACLLSRMSKVLCGCWASMALPCERPSALTEASHVFLYFVLSHFIRCLASNLSICSEYRELCSVLARSPGLRGSTLPCLWGPRQTRSQAT